MDIAGQFAGNGATGAVTGCADAALCMVSLAFAAGRDNAANALSDRKFQFAIRFDNAQRSCRDSLIVDLVRKSEDLPQRT
jgi:hypothetical protein